MSNDKEDYVQKLEDRVSLLEKVIERLMRKDMWSGWGIRTLSADHPSFKPYSYQTGAIWPHDNALIALGMRRYGFAAQSAAVARDISAAASHFMLNQLPELYGGLQRDPTSFPVQYLGANVPQAWAAGAPFMLLQAMLGLHQDAPAGKLYVAAQAKIDFAADLEDLRKFELQLVDVPAGILVEPVQRQPQQPKLGLVEIINGHGGYFGKAERLGGKN
jgi:glycogen debranching enzyme